MIVEVPEGLNKKQKKLIRELEETLSDSNFPLTRKLKTHAKRFFARKKKMEG
jgi:DnaJ-class molecular chaperone